MSLLDPRWDALRAQMPIAAKWAYFDHASVAPLPKASAAALVDWAREACEEGDVCWGQWNGQIQRLRHRCAEMIHAHPDEIAIVHSTTEGINLVAEGLDWREGDNVVTLADEYPANQYPWIHQQTKGVEVRRIATEGGRVDLSRLSAACDSRTRVLTVSWVNYLSGWRNDLAAIVEIAHRVGAFCFLDAIQGLGAFAINVQELPIDFLAADGHKWMLGPEGAGMFYLRREHLDRLRAVGIGANSMVDWRDYARIEMRLKPDASRYEGGAPNSVGAAAWLESLALLHAAGLENIAQQILDYTDFAADRLLKAGATLISPREERRHCSGIVTFDWPGVDPNKMRDFCIGRGVVLSCRSNHLRISPHAYNNEADLERLIEALLAARQSN